MTATFATTQFGNILYWTNSDPQALPTESAAQATSIVNALNAVSTQRSMQNWTVANVAARTALTGMVVNDRAYQSDVGVTYRYNGSAWKEWESDYISWATPPTNLTVGTAGVIVQRYKWVGGRLYFDYSYTLGTSGFAMGTSPTINFPISVKLFVPGGGLSSGDGAVRDVSVPSTPAFTRVNIGSSITGVIGTYNGSFGSITATVPMTWAAGDILAGGFWVDPA